MGAAVNSGTAQQAKTLVVGRALATLGEALIPLVIVRLLGKAEVGDLAATLALYQVVAVVFSLGVGNAAMYFVPGVAPELRSSVAYRHLGVLARLGLCGAAVLVGIAAFSLWAPDGASGSARWFGGGERVDLRYLFAFALLPVADLPARIAPNLFVLEQRANVAAITAIAKSVGQTAATLVPAALGLSLWWVVASVVAFGWVYFAALFIALRRIYGPRGRETTAPSTREILRFAVPLGATDIVSMLVTRLDTLLVVVALSTTAVAEYQAGAFQLPFLTTVAYSVGAVYMPVFRESFARGAGAEAIAVWRSSATKVALLVVPTSLVFFVAAEEVITLLFTDAYLAAVPVFRCYLVMTMSRVTTFGSVLVAAGKPQWVLRSALISLASNFVLSVPLLLLLGYLGPALGTALSLGPMFVAYCVYIARAAGVPFSHTFPFVDYGKVLLLAAIPATLAWVLKDAVVGVSAGALGLRIALSAGVVIGGFVLLAMPLKIVRVADLRFLIRSR